MACCQLTISLLCCMAAVPMVTAILSEDLEHLPVIHQCSYPNFYSDDDNGKLLTCSFDKISDTSALRVAWNGIIRTRPTTNGVEVCSEWWFTINGEMCQSPGNINMVMNSDEDRWKQASYLDGICLDIPAGQVNVGFHIGKCGDDPKGNGKTGTAGTTSRILLEEVCSEYIA